MGEFEKLSGFKERDRRANIETNSERDFDTENAKLDLEQKKRLFNHLIKITWSIFTLVVAVLFLNFASVSRYNKAIFSDIVVNVLAVGMFAEVFGVISIIAKYLWSSR